MYKYLGILDEKIAEYWNLEEHKNKPILVYDDRIQHVIDAHIDDFENLEKIYQSYEMLGIIIKKPDYVFYNNKTKGLEYYKNIKPNICVAVRINTGKVLKVRSWYPANTFKISNRKRKELAMMSVEDDKCGII